MKFGNLRMEIFNSFSILIHLFLLLLKFTTMIKQSLIFLFMFKSLFSKCNLFCLNLLFKLINLVIYDFISSFSLSNFILSL